MAEVFRVSLLVAGGFLVLVAYWLASAALFPAWVARARDAGVDRPVRATLLGAVIGVPLTLIGGSMAMQGPDAGARAVGALVVSIPILLALGGSTGLALRIGAGLALPSDATAPWLRVLRGGTVLALTFLLPVVGWFVVFPWALMQGVGVALLAIRRRARPVTITAEIAG